jgi:hypothetical protein
MPRSLRAFDRREGVGNGEEISPKRDRELEDRAVEGTIRHDII